MMRNLGKRKHAEPWALQTTFAYRVGEQSIAEQKLTAWRKGELEIPDVYVDHREAVGKVDIDDRGEHPEATATGVRRGHGPGNRLDGKPSGSTSTCSADRVLPDEQDRGRYYLNRPSAKSDAWLLLAVYDKQTKTARGAAEARAKSLWASMAR